MVATTPPLRMVALASALFRLQVLAVVGEAAAPAKPQAVSATRSRALARPTATSTEALVPLAYLRASGAVPSVVVVVVVAVVVEVVRQVSAAGLPSARPTWRLAALACLEVRRSRALDCSV